ncbi:OTU-domain-containing protein [Choiromyces venosus 120613-1]|uniref:OTU-domain-containing protein n=1 Tax=Choiromyces venosus 120613-1 TaxID=1336337 RepID=A0A3N4JMS0_9PEZI|nr:OTU-domain-containing protein [Choiromyces venosus 120613-1]
MSETNREEMFARHRKEIRELTARITQKKKNATKKTRRGITSECESLEHELKERQSREIAALDNPDGESIEASEVPESKPEGEEEKEKDRKRLEESNTNTNTTTNTTASNDTPQQSPAGSKKPNRQKARLARRAAEAAALSAVAEAEASALPNPRQAEMRAMQTLLANLHLSEKEIAPDGHCLYSAFADQLPTPSDYKTTRKKCAEYMLAHRDEFEPFLEEPIEEHVRKIGETAEWGGQTEVLALAKAFGVIVNVVQTEGRGVEKMNEEGVEGEVWLGYYRHSFGLGEHYNSLKKVKAEGGS